MSRDPGKNDDDYNGTSTTWCDDGRKWRKWICMSILLVRGILLKIINGESYQLTMQLYKSYQIQWCKAKIYRVETTMSQTF